MSGTDLYSSSRRLSSTGMYIFSFALHPGCYVCNVYEERISTINSIISKTNFDHLWKELEIINNDWKPNCPHDDCSSQYQALRKFTIDAVRKKSCKQRYTRIILETPNVLQEVLPPEILSEITKWL